MNESVGYTVTINIIITFIIIVFVFLSNALIYYKSNKASNVIVDSIEKYSGYNEKSKNEITQRLAGIGYNKTKISCSKTIEEKNGVSCNNVYISSSGKVIVARQDRNTVTDGYCVYVCDSGDNYYYKVKANMMINIPVINEIVNGTVYSSTGNMYDFKGVDIPSM